MQISSSKFHLKPDGTVTLSGNVTITGGDLAGVTATTISGSATEALANLEAGVSASIDTASGSLSASVATTQTNLSSSVSERIMTDISGSIVALPPAPGGQGLFLSYPYMGFYSSSIAKDQPGDGWKAFISASGAFMFKSDDENLISFGAPVSGSDGTVTTNFVLRATNTYLSSSKANI